MTKRPPVNVRTTPLVKRRSTTLDGAVGSPRMGDSTIMVPQASRPAAAAATPIRAVASTIWPRPSRPSRRRSRMMPVVELATLPTVWPMATTAMAHFGSRANVMRPAVSEIVVSTNCMTRGERPSSRAKKTR